MEDDFYNYLMRQIKISTNLFDHLNNQPMIIVHGQN